MELAPGGGAGGLEPLLAEPRPDEAIDRVICAFHLRGGRVLHGPQAPPVHAPREARLPGQQGLHLGRARGLVPRVRGAGEDPRLEVGQDLVVESRPTLGHLEPLELVAHDLEEHALAGIARAHDGAEEGLLQHGRTMVEADATLGLTRAAVAGVAVLDQHGSDPALEELRLIGSSLPALNGEGRLEEDEEGGGGEHGETPMGVTLPIIGASSESAHGPRTDGPLGCHRPLGPGLGCSPCPGRGRRRDGLAHSRAPARSRAQLAPGPSSLQGPARSRAQLNPGPGSPQGQAHFEVEPDRNT